MSDQAWWRDAVVYQVYIRSFADGNGDGTGDLAGLRSRLGYLRDLGVDAIWVNPWYPSPLLDGGYDVADYRDIDPRFGTLAEAETFIAEAHAHGLRVLLDIVPNHTSWEHPWFRAALATGPGSLERARYWFRPSPDGDATQPPNDWRSVFGGPAWERVDGHDGGPGEWYLHLFDVSQPDLNWDNPEVRAEFEDVLRFWFDRGADGFRIDVAHGMVKDPALPPLRDDHEGLLTPPDRSNHPHWDLDGVHEIYRGWRAIADGYDPPRAFVAEAWLETPDRLARYLRPDELHSAFAFEFVSPGWDAIGFRRAIDDCLAAVAPTGTSPTWVLSNHDILRHVTRFGAVDVALGRRRARAAILLMLALPGAAYLYQGEELGLEEVLAIPDELRDDPVFHRTGGKAIGRDGCRVPIPWDGSEPALGFGTAPPWLPQPEHWADQSVQAQQADPQSMLELYRAALHLRRVHPALGDGTLTWLDAAPDVLAFARDPGLRCLVNLGSAVVPLPPGRVLLASLPAAGELPPDVGVWLADEATG